MHVNRRGIWCVAPAGSRNSRGSLLEVIATGEAISADAIAGMIRVLHHDELDDLAVKLAIDVLLQDMRLCN